MARYVSAHRLTQHTTSFDAICETCKDVYADTHLQCINSISRPILNQRLVEALPSDIKARFNVKLSRIDFKSRRAYALARSSPNKKADSVPGQEEAQTQGTGGKLEKTGHGSRGKAASNWVEDEDGTAFDLVVGCDGSWSKVRSEMMRVERYVFPPPLQPRCLW